MSGAQEILLDPVGGMAGDMFIAAAVDLWPELEAQIRSALDQLGLPTGSRVGVDRCVKGGLAARSFSVVVPGDRPHATPYADLRGRLDASRLPDRVRTHAAAMLELLARAEANAHGVALDRVHLHELGDWDSVADLVGAAVVIEHAHGSHWHYSTLPLGRGTVQTRHGQLPVPVPAVTSLLSGFMFSDDGLPGERITPTGAAILRYLQAQATPGVGGRLLGTGCGAGRQDLAGKPNVLRLLAFAGVPVEDAVIVIRFDVDDQTGEDLAIALERIRAAPGVLDVCAWGALGKKGRPLQCVQVLCEPAAQDAAMMRCLDETATLGLRWSRTQRRILERTIQRRGGGEREVTVKRTRRPAGSVTSKIEATDVEAANLDYAGRERLRRKIMDNGHDND